MPNSQSEIVRCPHCSITIGHPPLDHAIRVDILHRALAGSDALAIAEAINRDVGYVRGVLKDLRKAGALPGGVGKRGRPKRETIAKGSV